jgi:predicted glycosyltransferase
MFGICGVASFDKHETISHSLQERMRDAFVHRGPNSAGLHAKCEVGVPARRLSIIDFADSHQPLTNTPILNECHDHKIWIDLDNSPHVPLFVPIIEELTKRGYNLLLTARDNAQVLELLDYYQLKCRCYGRHYGKYKPVKVLGIGLRVLQLAPLILKEKPDFALSHGSRTQIMLSSLLRIPCLAMSDYEHASMAGFGFRPGWIMVPEVVPGNSRIDRNHTIRYPGIKEDVYVPRFRPTPGIRAKLGLSNDDLVVTIRPPASEAHYHNPASDELFRCVVEFLGQIDGLRMVLLPRYNTQAATLRHLWPDLFNSGKALIPEHAIDGLNLIWFSDFVVSGGGTMNREAAALGVPVYSIFLGKQGAVDRYLAECGRLILLESQNDLNMIRLVRRAPPANPDFSGNGVLTKIVDHVTATIEIACHAG